MLLKLYADYFLKHWRFKMGHFAWCCVSLLACSSPHSRLQPQLAPVEQRLKPRDVKTIVNPLDVHPLAVNLLICSAHDALEEQTSINYFVLPNGWVELQGEVLFGSQKFALRGAVRAAHRGGKAESLELEAVPDLLDLKYLSEEEGVSHKVDKLLIELSNDVASFNMFSSSGERLFAKNIDGCKIHNLWHLKRILDYPLRPSLGSDMLRTKAYRIISNSSFASEMNLSVNSLGSWLFSIESVVKRRSTPNGVIVEAPVKKLKDGNKEFFLYEESCLIKGYPFKQGITLTQVGECDAFGFGVNVSGEYFLLE